jgi:flagellar biogenesis protein FliO
MEKNNFNKAYIYIIAIFAIGVAISNIISFFNGVGFAFIGASLFLILAIIILVIYLRKKTVAFHKNVVYNQ